MGTIEWTIERLQTVQALVLAGLSASVIAERFGCTRNAILVLVHRKRMRRQAPGKAADAPIPRRSPRSRQPSDAPAAITLWLESRVTYDTPARVIPAGQNSQPRNLVTLTNFTCRWPINDGAPYLFCGAPEANLEMGLPYCPFHTLAAFRRGGAE